MKYEFEGEHQTFIINPDYEDLEKFKIKFTVEENGGSVLNAKLLYLAQARGIDDDNSYDTYILYEKEGKLFTFHEHENNANISYFIEHKESSKKGYLAILNSLDFLFVTTFFKDAMIQYNFSTLNSEVPIKDEQKRKNKI